jgi:small subunit ribosomal protein S24e
LSTDLLIVKDHKNSLLNRREIQVVMKYVAGKMKRVDAADLIANRYNVDKNTVIPISLLCQTGKQDIHAKFYIYDNEGQAKRDLPRYRFLRKMTKDDRKKLIDSEKAENLKAKQSSTNSESNSKRKSGKGKK